MNDTADAELFDDPICASCGEAVTARGCACDAEDDRLERADTVPAPAPYALPGESVAREVR